MWLLSRQLLSPYTATRPPLLCCVSPSTACRPPAAAVPKRPADRAVPAATGCWVCLYRQSFLGGSMVDLRFQEHAENSRKVVAELFCAGDTPGTVLTSGGSMLQRAC